MAFTSASKTRMARVAETVWGVTPATPAFKNFRMTGESLNAEKQTAVTNEIRPDRNISDLIQVARTTSGNLDAEFSYASFDDEFESALANVWTADVLKNGIIQKSLTYEKTFLANDTDEIFHRFAGSVVNTMAIGVTAQQLITLGFGVMGRGITTGVAPITGATYADALVTDVLSAAADFGSLAITGLAEQPSIMAITLDTTNNLRQQPVVGSLNSAGLGDGRFGVTGTLNAYFEGGPLYDAFNDHDAVAISFLLGTDTGSQYRVTMPKVKLSQGTIVAGSNDSDVMASLSYQALYDPTLGCTIQIERGTLA